MGFVNLVESDKREGVQERLLGVEDPGIMDVLDAIRRLDGENYTVVSLEGNDGLRRMTIGGGNNGFYNVYIAVDIDREFYNLLNPDALPDSLTTLITGGQAGNFPTTHCVDIQTAIKAAEVFFESGEPAPELQWDMTS